MKISERTVTILPLSIQTILFHFVTRLIFKSFGIPEIFISSLPENLSNILIQKYADKFKHIYPDTTGHFPNDAEYDYDQVILGQFVN